MSLSAEEKMMVQESLQVYLQLIARQVPPQQVQQMAQIAEGIIKKLDNLNANAAKGATKPIGITDEWFKNVCKTCDKQGGPTGCTDKVTEKYPGKCDPILHYENAKLRKGK